MNQQEIQQCIEQILEDTRLKNETIRQLEEKLIGLKEQLKQTNNEKEQLLLSHNLLFQESENFQRIIAQFEDLKANKFKNEYQEIRDQYQKQGGTNEDEIIQNELEN